MAKCKYEGFVFRLVADSCLPDAKWCTISDPVTQVTLCKKPHTSIPVLNMSEHPQISLVCGKELCTHQPWLIQALDTFGSRQRCLMWTL